MTFHCSSFCSNICSVSVYWSCLCVHFIIRRSLLGWYLWFFISLQLYLKIERKKIKFESGNWNQVVLKPSLISIIAESMKYVALYCLKVYMFSVKRRADKINFLYVRSTRLKSNIFGEKQIHWFYLLKYWQSNEI